MVAPAERRRSEEVRVKLSPALATEFAAIAEGRGLLPATLAAVALGEYVEQWRMKVRLQRMVAIDCSKRMADTMFNEEKIGEAIAAALNNPELVGLITGHQQPEAGNAGGSVSGAGPEAAASPGRLPAGQGPGEDRARTAT